MKIIAFYLPQFHEIPENNEWWGEGFTEWTKVKAATSLYEDHYQPRVPLNNNYYNLLDEKILKWQVKIAKEHGIYGFCFYHYWFDGHKLLEKPVENYLKDASLDLPYCLSWPNGPWTKAWVGKGDKILIKQRYGGKKEWKVHFDYLLPHFKDKRYIRIDDKPIFIIYSPELIENGNEMLDYFQELAKENNLPGLVFAYQGKYFERLINKDDSRYDFNIEYQPSYAFMDDSSLFKLGKRFINKKIAMFEEKLGLNVGLRIPDGLQIDTYDKIWERILERTPQSNKNIPGAFVDWDNTPRRNDRGRVCQGATPDKFKAFMKAQIKKAKTEYKKDYIFMFAWNEWAESGYLEPDEKYGYSYLEALREALIETGEFPETPNFMMARSNNSEE